LQNLHFDPRVTLLEAGACTGFRWEMLRLKSFHWKYYWNPNGSGKVRFGGREHSLGRRNACLIPPGTEFEPISLEPMDHLYLHFSCSGKASRIYRHGTYEVPPQPRQADAVFRDLLEVDEASARLLLRCLSLIHEALAYMPEEATITDPRVADWLQVIDASPETAGSNEAFARHIGLHSQSAIRLFRQQTGMTPRQYILQKRLQKACLLLRQTSLSLDLVAERSGFTDRRYMGRLFAKRLGMSPAVYRAGVGLGEGEGREVLVQTRVD